MLRLATCEAEKTFTKEVQSGPEEVEDCTKVARWIGSLKIKNCEKVWKFEWLQYPTGHLSVCRLRLKKSLVPVADCCQGPLNMWKTFEYETKMWICSYLRGTDEKKSSSATLVDSLNSFSMMAGSVANVAPSDAVSWTARRALEILFLKNQTFTF